MAQQSLSYRRDPLSSATYQLALLESQVRLTPFADKLAQAGMGPLRPTSLEILQVNVGKMCNQVCGHCHVDAGPDRKEVMSRDTMQQCLEVLKRVDIKTVDVTGGAPEMNPHFRWFVEELTALGKHVIVRCNLTIVVANKKYNDLPVFYRDHKVEIACSLPFYSAERTDRQRGDGVFKHSIEALHMLNDVGYGKVGSGLILNLIYNPAGAFLPANQEQMERDFRLELKNSHNIEFNHLFCITNMPVSRYLEYLIRSGNYERYMDRLLTAFNPKAAENVMCRNTISVGWDGHLYDCDFNQMLELPVDAAVCHISRFDLAALAHRDIRVNQHCYGCTAGTGSSCSGATV
jgi:radical SAM/Cys-rich protein